MLPHYPLLHPSHKKFILHMVSKIIFCLVLKLGFMFPQTSVKQMYLTSQLNIFFLCSVFSPLHVFTFYLLLLWPKTTCSNLFLPLSSSLPLIFFPPAWMYDPAHRLNHLWNFFRQHSLLLFSEHVHDALSGSTEHIQY